MDEMDMTTAAPKRSAIADSEGVSSIPKQKTKKKRPLHNRDHPDHQPVNLEDS
jgi:hypothetical protein